MNLINQTIFTILFIIVGFIALYILSKKGKI